MVADYRWLTLHIPYAYGSYVPYAYGIKYAYGTEQYNVLLHILQNLNQLADFPSSQNLDSLLHRQIIEVPSGIE